MRTSSRAGARTVGMVAASGAALLLAPGIAMADHPGSEFPNCDSRHYPPAQCDPPSGGAGHEAPPLQANPSERVPPGTPVSMNASGCAPGAAVVIGLARMSSPAQIIGLTETNADDEGAYSTSAAIPENLSDGTYVMYGECRSPNSNDTTVNTSSFTVQASPQSGTLRSSSGSASTGSSTTQSSGSSAATTSDAPAATAAELPASFTPPAGWTASPAVKAAVTEAVNLRLAAMKAALPAQAADTTAAPAAAVESADYTPWYAAAGAGALLLLGAAGWRRRATVGNDTNSEASA